MSTDETEATGFEQLEWVETLRNGLAESDQRIRTSALEDGWAVVSHRGHVVRDALRCFFQQMVREVPPRGAFAIDALGGTGRLEICPGSDVDVGIIVENIEENGRFHDHVSNQLLRFASLVPGLRDVIKVNAFPDLSYEEHFDLKSLASLLDAELLIGDATFDRRISDDTGEILEPVMELLRAKLTDLGNGQAKFSCFSPSTNKGMHYAISRLLPERAGANIESIARDGTHDWPIPRTNFYIRIQSDISSVAEALRKDLGEVQIVYDAL